MTKLIEALLNERTGREPERRISLRNVFDEQELHPIVEHGVRDLDGTTGSMDIFLPTRKICVEVKELGKVDDPYKPGTGSRTDESAYEQVRRYIHGERVRQQHIPLLDPDNQDVSYLGIVTDGNRVWMWVWQSDLIEGNRVRSWWNRELKTVEDVFEFISVLKSQYEGKQWAPTDPTAIFKPFVADLVQFHKTIRDVDSTVTQFHLWKKQLEISGNSPPSARSEAEHLFVLHSAMIAISRGIRRTISQDLESNGISMDGFAGWCNDQDWLREKSGLIQTLNQYDWVSQPGDVMRPLFHGIFDKKYRKLYGEYYTPDWLAEGIVNHILDDRWLKDQMVHAGTNQTIRKAGVLDPACGSGTFLYHAARRIVSQSTKYGVTDRRWQADLAARLIHGFDLHPVAVEMSKTTLLRGLPAIPNVPLQVYQCDSLMTLRKAHDELQFTETSIEFDSRDGNRISVPLNFSLSSQFEQHLNALVESARKRNPLPPYINLMGADQKAVEELHQCLTNVIASEGDDVWAWYIRNQSATARLLNSKVDRIIANPPWVRISNIQDKTRKAEISELARRNKIWVGGKNATGFDLSALFAFHCPRLYLDETKKPKCGWVLPYGAINAGNWSTFRNRSASRLVELWDLGSLPFPKQSKCCVRFEEVSDPNDVEPRDFERKRLIREPDSPPVESNETWTTVSEKTSWCEFEEEFEDKPSKWLDENGTPLARQGATLVPYCLVKVDSSQPGNTPDMCRFRTVPSRHQPWKTLGSKNGEVPNSWVVESVFSEGLFPFRVKTQKVILPLSNDRSGWADHPDGIKYWKDASSLYERNAGIGPTTPKTLLGNIDFQNKLTSQLRRIARDREKGEVMVVVNSSGTWLVAARCNTQLILESSMYWVVADSVNEAKFLCGLLNAECLANAFKASRNSDRHFHTHFWKKVPIPRYSSKSKLHKAIVKLVTVAESEVANQFEIQKYRPTNNNSVKSRDFVRTQLRESGIQAKINEAVGEILPNYAREVNE